jgi:hypothetical protein
MVEKKLPTMPFEKIFMLYEQAAVLPQLQAQRLSPYFLP